MGIASTIAGFFSGNADKIIDSAGSAIDRLVTSDEEKLTLTNELEKIRLKSKLDSEKLALGFEQELTQRLAIDMKSDSWLSKNIRPISLAFLTASTIILAYLTIFSTLTPIQAQSLKEWQSVLLPLLLTCYGFYFGGRSIEKLKLGKKD